VPDIGQCRRNAPAAANQAVLFAGEAIIAIGDVLSRKYDLEWPSGTDGEVTESTHATMFPRTYSDQWCGDFTEGQPIGEPP
jgi:hypothetical protein